MKIGVTGSTGMLGSEVADLFSAKGYGTVCLPREILSHETSLDKVVELLSVKGIDILVHCAANTNVELCEEKPELCELENYQFSETLAKATDLAGIKLVFISSTGVYGKWK
ncbi:sugar nucleotide-binding protein, partial [Vibrio rotiferianus]